MAHFAVAAFLAPSDVAVTFFVMHERGMEEDDVQNEPSTNG